jgi:hypothetical protein
VTYEIAGGRQTSPAERTISARTEMPMNVKYARMTPNVRADLPPASDVNRDSGREAANGG